jgi:hypothetical protein
MRAGPGTAIAISFPTIPKPLPVLLLYRLKRSNTYFFVDPGKDHLCTGEIRMGDMDGVLRKRHEYWWFDFEQLPTGHWYPTKEHYISYGNPQRGTSGYEELRNIHIQLLDENEFPVGIFDGEKLKEGAEVKDALY